MECATHPSAPPSPKLYLVIYFAYSQGVACYDDTDGNAGLAGPHTGASVDIEAGGYGSFHVAYGVRGI